MDNLQDVTGLRKNISLVWGSFITQENLGLAALSLLTGYLEADKSDDKNSKTHYAKMLKATIERIPELSELTQVSVSKCSFCSRSDRALVAGALAFICYECANIAVKELTDNDN